MTNIYLITSESYKKMNEEVDKIINSSLNVVKYDLRVDSMNDALIEAGYYSLDPEMKYIIINVGNLLSAKAKKGEETEEDEEEPQVDDPNLKSLEKYLEHPSDIATVILTTSFKPDKRKKTYKQIQKLGKVIEITTMNKKDLTYDCITKLKLHKYFCSYELASYIVDNSFCNYDIMTNELEKVYLGITPKSLTKDDLDGIINETLSDNIFKYMYAIFDNNLEEAVKASKDFDRLKVEPAVVLVVMAKEIYNLYYIKSGVSLKELQNYLHKEDWQMNQYKENADKFTLNELKKIIVKLNDYDYKYKSGRIDKSILLDLLTIDLCD